MVHSLARCNVDCSRRSFLLGSLALSGAALAGSCKRKSASLPPCTALTRGPHFHWFGYYDKLQFDHTSRFVLGMRTTFENKMPTNNPPVELGVIDSLQPFSWEKLGESRAWSWQQGCMLQWVPQKPPWVIWNDYYKGRFIARMKNFHTGE
ncbi:hypothetical protein KKF84_16440, partial [Myxococcota bacterium]|nr:hypothetical protein [Myxococcota bacterium]MBU1536915.1 hypothetical protein [Myxococcota bacterium]